MDIGIISTRYAKALLKYAREKGVEDEVYKEFVNLAHSFAEYPELKVALDNPILTRKEKLELISIAANGKESPGDTFIRFMKLVLKKHREVFLQYMTLTYIHLYYQLKHIAIGRLITAVPIDENTIERIRKIASTVVHAEMELNSVVDPAIDGGFVFDINDYRLDASIATQLKKVKQQFIEKNKRIV